MVSDIKHFLKYNQSLTQKVTFNKTCRNEIVIESLQVRYDMCIQHMNSDDKYYSRICLCHKNILVK